MLQAFDLVEHRYVACKLHGLNAQWSEEKKQSYIRHAIREYNIHKTLVHRHIVRLWDIFEIDHNTFCTVLEYCSGMTNYLPAISSDINWKSFPGDRMIIEGTLLAEAYTYYALVIQYLYYDWHFI